MKKFLLYIVLLLLPFAIIITPAYCVLYKAGELHDITYYIRDLKTNQYFGLAYSEMNAPYKFRMANYKQPKVLAIGSSRIMQVREDVINPLYSFYNAGGATESIEGLEIFVRQLSYTPELIIVNLDQFPFNPNFTIHNPGGGKAISFDPVKSNLSGIINTCLTFISDFMKGKLSQDIFTSDNLGITARVNKNGFANDGSYHYTYNELHPELQKDYGFSNTKSRIRLHNRRFEEGDKVDKTLLPKFSRFLDMCQNRGIKVIAIIPPFAPTINELLRADGGYTYMDKIYTDLSPVFQSYKDCYLYDFRDVEGLDDSYYVDGFHGSVVVYNKILSTISKSTPELSGYFKPVPQIQDISNQYKYRFQ
jgi:hypothetical protein